MRSLFNFNDIIKSIRNGSFKIILYENKEQKLRSY